MKDVLSKTDPSRHFVSLLSFKINSQLQLGVIRALIHGELNNRWQLHFKLQSPDIHKIDPSYQGASTLTGAITGNAETPRLQSNLTVNYFKLLTLPDTTFNGRLALQTTVNLSNNSCFSTSSSSDTKNCDFPSLRLSGANFQVNKNDQFNLLVSPDLILSNHGDVWYVTGNILIPKATVTMANTESVVTLPEETVIINANTRNHKSEENSAIIFAEILIKLGNSVYVNAKGLTGRLTGQVKITEDPNHLPIGQGKISIKNGSYDLRGDKLTIDRGDAIFSHSYLDNPFLEIRASKLIDYSSNDQNFTQQKTIKVGFLISGTLDSPRIQLFSDPVGWSQADILSLIVLGQPASIASGANLQILLRATQALNSGNTFNVGSLQKNIQQAFGLNEFGFSSGLSNDNGNTQQTSAFRLGKTFSPRLSLSYSLNILNAENTFRLKYWLRKYWILQTASSSSGTEADIFYSIKK